MDPVVKVLTLMPVEYGRMYHPAGAVVEVELDTATWLAYSGIVALIPASKADNKENK
jgi:hypothetical protein